MRCPRPLRRPRPPHGLAVLAAMRLTTTESGQLANFEPRRPGQGRRPRLPPDDRAWRRLRDRLRHVGPHRARRRDRGSAPDARSVLHREPDRASARANCEGSGRHPVRSCRCARRAARARPARADARSDDRRCAACRSDADRPFGGMVGAGLDLAYRWERCRGESCEVVGRERTYVVSEADAAARCASSSPRHAQRASHPSLPPRILVLPRNEVRPTIAGRARVGSTLTAHRGTWTGTELRFSYAWLRCRVNANWSGKTVSRSPTYRPRRADRGWRLKLVVTAVNDLADETALSRLTARIH